MSYRNIREPILNFIRENKFIYGVIIVLTILLSGQRIAIPHLYGKIVNELKDGNLGKASTLFAFLNITWFGFQALLALLSWIQADNIPKLHNSIREWFFRVTAQSGVGEVDVGGVLNKLMRFPVALADYYDIISDFILNNCVTIVVTSVYLWQYHPLLAAIFVGSLVVSIGVGYFFQRFCLQASETSEEILDESNDELEDVLANLSAIHGANTSPQEEHRVKEVFEKVSKAFSRAGRCQIPYRIVFSVLASISLVLINVLSLKLLKSQSLDLSASVSIFIVSYSALSVIMTSYTSLRDFLYTVGRLQIISKFIETLPKMTGSTPSPGPIEKNPEITLERLGLNGDINYTIPPGSRLIIRGSIGSGKSTIAKVLAGLIPAPEGGQVLVDGKPATQEQLRSLVYYVPQTSPLFRRTLWENLIYGHNEKITPAEVLDILRNAGLTTVAERFDRNLGRNAGSRGSYFSGGERQLVWLVRASLVNKPIIVFDEPTASLDPASRRKVERLMRFIARKKTIVVITHEEDLLQGWFTHSLRIAS